MIGTLLIQPPSPHTGGELLIRRGSREARIDLSGTARCIDHWLAPDGQGRPVGRLELADGEPQALEG